MDSADSFTSVLGGGSGPVKLPGHIGRTRRRCRCISAIPRLPRHPLSDQVATWFGKSTSGSEHTIVMTIHHTAEENLDQPARVQILRRFLGSVSDAAEPIVDVIRPYIEGLESLPADGRFLLVANHTQSFIEVPLILHYVRRGIGRRAGVCSFCQCVAACGGCGMPLSGRAPGSAKAGICTTILLTNRLVINFGVRTPSP